MHVLGTVGLACAAVTQAIEQADKQMEAELEKVTGGVKIPGMA